MQCLKQLISWIKFDLDKWEVFEEFFFSLSAVVSTSAWSTEHRRPEDEAVKQISGHSNADVNEGMMDTGSSLKPLAA